MPAPDVAVVGGGIVGTAAAAYLARDGARVTLYESGPIAAGASGRNSGVVQHPADAELAALYLETLTLYGELGDAVDETFALPSEPAGLLYISRQPDAAQAQAAAIAAAQPGLEPEVVDGMVLLELEPSLAPGLVACRVAIGYPVAPAAATRAFARWARSLGVRVRTSTPVDLVIDGDRVAGVRAEGLLEPSGTVLVAAGPWSPALLDPGGRWRPIRPRWGVVVSVGLASPPRHVLEQAGIKTEPGETPPADDPERGADHDVEFSLVTANGLSSVGSTFLPSEPEPAEWAPRILRAGASFVPGIASATVLGYRSCARPLALDGRPLVGRVPWLQSAFITAGHGPWGISTGAASARQVADAILGVRAAIPGAAIAAAFDPGRFGAP